MFVDGASTVGDERILIVGATNRPQDLDDAARRRLVKRLYIPLPDCNARQHIVKSLLEDQGNHTLSEEDMELISQKTDGYSGADMAELCKERLSIITYICRSCQGADRHSVSVSLATVDV